MGSAIFSQTHLVTLSPKQLKKMLVKKKLRV
jgi:hypothetical protein